MSGIIIGIHGLGNKPPARLLETWWQRSLQEGLGRSGARRRFVDFRLVYWANFLHPAPLQPGIADPADPHFIEDPYCPAPPDSPAVRPSALRRRVVDFIAAQVDKIFLNEDLSINYAGLTDLVVEHFFSDLDAYYRTHCPGAKGLECPSRDAICGTLAAVLRKYRRRRILLVAHSMGSIIAYDVLTRYAPEVTVDTLVTIGSPLGLPVIKARIAADRKAAGEDGRRLRTPANVTAHWYNLADLRDKIALDYALGDDFEANARHVQVVDRTVTNDYAYGDLINPHKSYGYLRTPEMAAIVTAFLERHRPAPLAWVRQALRRLPGTGPAAPTAPAPGGGKGVL